MSLKPFFEEEIEFFNHWFSNHPWELHTHDLGTDMHEEGNELIVKMHLPEDIDHEDISIELIGDNRLKVSGSCEGMHEEWDEGEEASDDECSVQKNCCKCTGDKCCKEDTCEKCTGSTSSETEEEWDTDEFECETFEQIVLLPANVDGQKAIAEFHDSVLTIRLPMISNKKHEPKKIAITKRS